MRHKRKRQQREKPINTTKTRKISCEKHDWKNIVANMLSIFSLLIGIASLVVSIRIGNIANEIAIRNQNVDPITEVPDSIAIVLPNGLSEEDTPIFTIDPIEIRHSRDERSGEYNHCFLAITDNGKADIQCLDNLEKGEMRNKNFINGMMFIETAASANSFEILFSVSSNASMLSTVNNQINMFHIIYKGYNGSYSIHTIVYTHPPESYDGGDLALISQLNLYKIDQNDLYDDAIMGSIATDLNSSKQATSPDAAYFSCDDVCSAIKESRNIIYAELTSSH